MFCPMALSASSSYSRYDQVLPRCLVESEGCDPSSAPNPQSISTPFSDEYPRRLLSLGEFVVPAFTGNREVEERVEESCRSEMGLSGVVVSVREPTREIAGGVKET